MSPQLSAKVGGMPAWAWLAGGGATVVVWFVFKRKGPQAATTGGANAANTQVPLGQTYPSTIPVIIPSNDPFNTGLPSAAQTPQSGTTVTPPVDPTPQVPAAVAPQPAAASLPAFAVGTGLTPVAGRVVGAVEQPGGGVDYATDQGAVYAMGGAAYKGGTNAHPEWNAGTIVSILPLQGGGYALVNARGQTYNFQ